MAFHCNIDAKGKTYRFISGLALLLLAVVLLIFWALPTGATLPWACAAASALTGAFALFEARAGWCAVRAMGFKTPW